ncbi:hypothetical protein LCGC14_1618380 [marine sediment metagenome]|uniref:Uncharacterized protein n=1 Tax=marine sediment metagenome TaxID=412755 RepID=A0A0F9I6I7_9ZZZZ
MSGSASQKKKKKKKSVRTKEKVMQATIHLGRPPSGYGVAVSMTGDTSQPFVTWWDGTIVRFSPNIHRALMYMVFLRTLSAKELKKEFSS